MCRADVATAICADQQHAGQTTIHQDGVDETDGRRAGPLQIVENEDHRHVRHRRHVEQHGKFGDRAGQDEICAQRVPDPHPCRLDLLGCAGQEEPPESTQGIADPIVVAVLAVLVELPADEPSAA